MQTGIVRRFMTGAAITLIAMIPLVAGAAGQFLVLGRTPLQGGNLSVVARQTECRLRSRGNHHPLGRMVPLVAAGAAVTSHRRAVRLVALGAAARLTMPFMALVAILLGMGAGQMSEFGADLRMTGQAGGAGVFRRTQVMAERLVPLMAFGTAASGEVPVVVLVVALTAARHDVLLAGRMGPVAADTRLLLVRPARGLHLLRHLLVTRSTDLIDLQRLLLDPLREVWRMATQAIELLQLRDMRIMTVQTLRLAAMLADMTLAAIEGAVLVRIELIEALLVAVAGDTDRPHLLLLAQIDHQRLVRVMAAGAVVQGKVPTFGPGMAIVTGQLGLFAIRQVLRVANGTGGKCGLMPCAVFGQLVQLFGVAGATLLAGDLIRLPQADNLRLVRPMATQAVGLPHRLVMRFVTVATDPLLGVITVTGRAVLLAVTARPGGELFADLLMAGDTDRRQRLAPLQLQVQRLVRRVTALTIPDAVMRLGTRGVADKTRLRQPLPFLRMLGMTVGATCGRMSLMTGDAAQPVAMGGAIFRHFAHLRLVAGGAEQAGGLAAEAYLQRRVRLVTAAAVVCSHRRAVPLMTTEAGRGVAVPLVALGTIHFTVGADEAVELFGNVFMAARADRSGIAQLRNILQLRLVGVVAAGAVVERKVRLLVFVVAVGTGGDGPRVGRVDRVATDTTEILPMLAAAGGKGGNGLLVAGGAQSRLDRFGKDRRQRCVRDMAGAAIAALHLLTVPVVTIETVGLLAMRGVALVTAHLPVSGFVFNKPGLELGMADEALARVESFGRNCGSGVVGGMAAAARFSRFSPAVPLVAVETFRERSVPGVTFGTAQVRGVRRRPSVGIVVTFQTEGFQRLFGAGKIEGEGVMGLVAITTATDGQVLVLRGVVAVRTIDLDRFAALGVHQVAVAATKLRRMRTPRDVELVDDCRMTDRTFPLNQRAHIPGKNRAAQPEQKKQSKDTCPDKSGLHHERPSRFQRQRGLPTLHSSRAICRSIKQAIHLG